MSFSEVKKDLEAELRLNTKSEIKFDFISTQLYSTDASNYKIVPLGVVIPRYPEDVNAIVDIARKYNVSIIPRGGGTSLAGQTVGHGLVIDFSKYLNKILSLSIEDREVTVQPGIYIEHLNKYLQEYGLIFGPDPSTARVATAGGVIANNSTGAHSILYGMAGDNIRSSKVTLSDGTQLELGLIDEKLLNGSTEQVGNLNELYRRIIDLRKKYLELINSKFPKHWRRASGYSLNYLTESQINISKLLAGSEGTLAVINELTLKLVDKPRYNGLLVFEFSNMLSAMDCVPKILQKEPSAIELIDNLLVSLTREHPGYSPLLSFLKTDPAAILVVEYSGVSEYEVSGKIDSLESYMMNSNEKFVSSKVLSEGEQEKIWSLRRAGLGLLMSKRDEIKPVPCIEDISVPIESLSSYVNEVTKLVESFDTTAAFYGHASAGCLHMRPLINMKSKNGIKIMKELTVGGLELALKYGGVLSGEHGDGLQRSFLNERLFGSEVYKVMKEIKLAFDPIGLLNPGKVVESPDPTANLRYGVDENIQLIETSLDWSSENSFQTAIEMCNGQGVCRKLGEGIMCPSFMATRDERDSTRARANILRSYMYGDLKPETLYGEELHSVFDLCISCKACKTECPSGVDMAKIKAEYLSSYKNKNGFTIRDRLFANIDRVNRITSNFPMVANFLNELLTKVFSQSMGISNERKLPKLNKYTFSSWYRKRKDSNNELIGEKVVYFCDTWTEYYQPSVGIATVGLLESIGFDVEIVEHKKCCGKPMISQGMLESARKNALENLSALSYFLDRGIPIIGTEPSCILTFKDEYLSLVPNNKYAVKLAENSYVLEEFLDLILADDNKNIAWKNSGPNVLFHSHCHHRALGDHSASSRVLTLSGCKVEESQAGCCGMAGSFGYEKEHYGISKLIGEDRLFPKIRSLPRETLVGTNGFSCFHQIQHFTGRSPIHIAQILFNQLDR